MCGSFAPLSFFALDLYNLPCSNVHIATEIKDSILSDIQDRYNKVNKSPLPFDFSSLFSTSFFLEPCTNNVQASEKGLSAKETTEMSKIQVSSYK
jgi:hypothetical protein